MYEYSPHLLSPVLNKFEIGRASNYEFPLYKEDSGFYKALREKVGAYFKDNKINPKVCTQVELMVVLVVPLLVPEDYCYEIFGDHMDCFYSFTHPFIDVKLMMIKIDVCINLCIPPSIHPYTQDPLPGLWRMTLVAVVAAATYLVMNQYFETNFYVGLIAAAIFGVCQVCMCLCM